MAYSNYWLYPTAGPQKLLDFISHAIYIVLSGFPPLSCKEIIYSIPFTTEELRWITLSPGRYMVTIIKIKK
jgi:hypothetical protein